MAIDPTKVDEPAPQVGAKIPVPAAPIKTNTQDSFGIDRYVGLTEQTPNVPQRTPEQFFNDLVPLYGIGDVTYQAPVQVDDSSALNRAIYGFRRGKSMLGNIYIAGQAAYNFPEYHNGRIMTTSEKFGMTDDQWDSMKYKEKVKLVKDADEAELRAKYPKAARAFDQNQAGIGTLTEFIATLGIESLVAFPVSITKSAVKTGIATGAFGGGFSISEDLGNGRDIDFGRAALATTLAGAAGGSVAKVGQKLRQRKEKQVEDFLYKYDEQVINDANLGAAIAKQRGFDKVAVPDIVEKQFGHTREVVNAAKERTGAKVIMPKTDAEAEFIIREARDLAEGQYSKKGSTRKLAERMFVPILSRIENISPALAMSLQRLEVNRHTKLFNYLSGEKDRKIIARATKVKPEEVNIGAGDAIKALGKLDDNDQFLVFTAARNGDDATVASILAKKLGKENAIKQTQQLRKIIDKTGDDLVRVGLLKQERRLKNYYPTFVKDFDGLMQALGKDKRVGQQQLNSWINQFARETGVDNINQVAPENIAEFLNKVATNQVEGIKGGKLKYTSERTMDAVPREYFKYYATLEDSVYDFITKSIDVTEQAKFLGMPNVVKAKTKSGKVIDDQIDVAASLTEKLNREAPALPSDAQGEVVSMLSSRFNKGQEAPSDVVRFLRDIGYAFTLANPFSALIQLSDIGLSAWMNGTTNTFKSILSKKEFDMLEFGLADTVSAIAVNPRDLSATLNTFMRVSGFQKLDRVGKNIYMNAAWKRVQKEVLTEKGLEKFAKKYKVAYGGEYKSLVSAVKAGNTADENVRLMMWQELSDAQPISLSKTPQSSLDVPNGRIFYALKMFALNQLNLVGRQTFKKIKSKNPAERAEGYKMTAMLLPTVAMMGASVTEIRKYIKNGMSGFEPDDLLASTGEHFLKMVGASYWTIDQLKKGNVMEAAGSYVTIPAFGIFADAVTGGMEIAQDGIRTDNTFLTRTPVVGPIMDVLLNDPASALRQEKLGIKPL